MFKEIPFQHTSQQLMAKTDVVATMHTNLFRSVELLIADYVEKCSGDEDKKAQMIADVYTNLHTATDDLVDEYNKKSQELAEEKKKTRELEKKSATPTQKFQDADDEED